MLVGNEEAEADAEQWVKNRVVGDAIDDYPSVYPLKAREVNSILSVAAQRSGEADFQRRIAREMNQLSLKERERRFEEIHGISGSIEETPDLVYESLLSLQEEVATIEQKEAYDMAISMDQAYVESKKFRLMFLRAELFDAKKAAERMVLFLEKKLKFFGRATLVRSIQMSDLDDDDITTLKSGVFQILPTRDRAGRPILFKCSNCGPKLYTSVLSYCKCWWYSVISTFEEDEQNQKRGAVLLIWWMDYLRKDPDITPELRKEIFGAVKWLPMRPYNSIHICIDHNTSKKLLSRVQIAMSPPEIRYNYKIHTGTDIEVMYKLMSFGIPTDAIPVLTSGAVKTKEFRKWVARHKKKEDFLALNGGTVFDRVDLPDLKDVLLAKGRPFQNHPGNQDYLLTVHEFLVEYDSAETRKGKREIIRKVVDLMRAKYVRFLNKDKDDWWVETPEKELHHKVMKAFSHASITTRKNSLAYAVKFTEKPSGKRKRIDPHMDLDSAKNGACRGQSCCTLGSG